MNDRLSLDELASDPARATELEPETALALAARCSALLLVLIPRAARSGSTLDTTPDVDVDARTAAPRTGMSPKWLYKHADELPFATRRGRRLLFNLRGIDRWRREQRGVA